MKKHRILSLLLAVFLAVGWLPFSVSAETADFIQPVTIHFILTPDGTSEWDSCQVESGTSYYDCYTELPEPERDGFSFVGWSTYPLEFREFDPYALIFDSGMQEPYLYGFWTENDSQTLTFYVDGEFYDEITVEDGSLPQMPQDPEREDRIFKQWLTEDGDPFDGSVTEDKNLYADWYDSVITYDPNGNLEDDLFEPLQFGADTDDPTPTYPDELDLEDYIFLGWDPEVAETVEESVTYLAKWEPRPQKTFTLTYKANTDDPVSGLPETNPEVFTTYDMDMETHGFTAAPVLTRTGFLFAHWSTEADDSGETVSPGDLYPVERDGILYAIWERETCQVTFAGFPGQDCFWGDSLPESAFPTPEMLGLNDKGCIEREGETYRFGGWNTAEDGSGHPFNTASPVTENLTVYPNWIQQIEITFQVKNGTWANLNNDSYVVTLDKGTALKSYLPTAIPNDGFQANGSWNAEPTTAETPATYVFTCTPKNQYTLTLKHEEVTETLKITEGEPIGPLPTLDNIDRNGRTYRFQGWNTAQDGSGMAVAETFLMVDDLTLYPQWIEQIAITFQIENGIWAGLESHILSLTLDKGAELKAYVPTAVPNDGFLAGGRWNMLPIRADASQTYVFTCDPKTRYTLTLQDEAIIETREILEGDAPGALPVLESKEKNGRFYRFGGWKTLGGAAFDETAPMTASLTICPDWIEQITVTFQIQGGIWEESGSSSYVVTLDKGAALMDYLPTALPDHAFKGSGTWSAAPAAAYDPTTYVYTCDARQRYTIILKDGEETTAREVMEGYPIGVLPELSKPSWRFTGWYAGDMPVTGDLLPEGDMELKAGWEKRLSLTFDANGGHNPPAPLEGSGPFPIPASRPARYGYRFLGWSAQREAEVPEFQTDDLYTPVGEDVLYAVWEPEEYEITYNDGVRTAKIFENMVFTAQYGDPTPEFNGRPTRKGYSFKGWSPKVADTVTGTALYEAQWAKVDKTNPKTGDESTVWLWLGMMCMSAAALMAIPKKKQR